MTNSLKSAAVSELVVAVVEHVTCNRAVCSISY